MSSQPEWVRRAQEAIAEVSAQCNGSRKAKSAALAAAAARRRDPLGRFLRSKPGKRYNETGREVMGVSVPLALAEMIRVEAEDVKFATSRMIVVLAALGLPAWQEMRERYFTGEYDSLVVPELVRAILNNAVNPVPPRSKKSLTNWHERVEKALVKPKPKSAPKDPTAAVLAGLGGSK